MFNTHRNELKRSCSSLSSDNVCAACGASFGAPHLLARHQKGCARTSEQLKKLRQHAEELERARKRSRMAEGNFMGASHLSPGANAGGGRSENQYSSEQSPVGGSTAEPAPAPAASLVHHPIEQSSGQAAPHNASDHPNRDLGNAHPAMEREAEGSSRGSPRASRKSPALEGSTSQDANRGYTNGEAGSGSNPESPPFNSALVSFRLRKRYGDGQQPASDPDAALNSVDLYDSTNHREDSDEESTEVTDSTATSDVELLAPFPNMSSFELGEWFYGQGNQKSLKDFKALIKILTSPSFSLPDIKDTKWTGVFQDLGKNKEDIKPNKSQWVDDSGWKTTEVKIDVPIHNRMPQGRGVESHVVGMLHHRSVVAVVEEKIRNAPESQFFHVDGHELLWKPDEAVDSPEFRVLSEFYNSDAFLEAQRQVRNDPPPEIEGCTLQRVVVGLSFWSDATHLSTFSSSKLWPLYMVFGNESKHRRGKNTSEACNHIAYFDSISDSFKDYLTGRTGGKIPPNLLAHLNRECFHEQWVIILDDELLRAIVQGIVVECSDGVKRRFFIRIFTYSTDYPERVLIATIKNRGDCPCVRCLTQKKNLGQMGTTEDAHFRRTHPRVESAAKQKSVLEAREEICAGKAVAGKPIQRLLSHSQVPTINAFSKRLSETGFDIYSALVVDVLHEFEIGVFKALFLHLLRILEALLPGSVLVHKLDKRYRSIPTFNQTIRKFSSNVSELKRRAARDYEDILQVAITAFHGLLPDSLGNLVSKLLYTNARWHALAKLRMQTDATILLLEAATSQLGNEFRSFIEATDTIATVELPREAEKRSRSTKKQQIAKKPQTTTFRIVQPAPEHPPPSPGERLVPTLGAVLSGELAPLSTSQDLPVGTSSVNAAEPAPFAFAQSSSLGSAGCGGSRGRGRGRGTRGRGGGRSTRGHGGGRSTRGRGGTRGARDGSGVQQDITTSPTITPADTPLTSAVAPPIASAAVLTHAPGTVVTASSASARDHLDSPNNSTQPVNLPSPVTPSTQDASPSGQGPPTTLPAVPKTNSASKNTRRPKKMNIFTVKFHALGHYPATIRHFGPTDLYSTEWGENFHRSPKAWFKSTSKKFIRKELSMHERRRMRLRRVKYLLLSTGKSPRAEELRAQRLASRNPDIHHYIGTSKSAPVHLSQFSLTGSLSADPACSHFVRNLKKHLLPRFVEAMNPHLEGEALQQAIQDLDWSRLIFRNDRIYTHKIMRIKYTTYDTRKDEDIIHLDTSQCNIMFLNKDYSYGASSHPFKYGKVIGILHAEVGYVGDIGRRGEDYMYCPIELLWVRWYRVHPPGGDSELDQVELLPVDAPASHSFVDPLEVMRACHIIPNFHEGLAYEEGTGKSAVANDGTDWKRYFVNRFVDRDMFMRYEWGLAVGHTYAYRDAVVANAAVRRTYGTTENGTAAHLEQADLEAGFRAPASDPEGVTPGAAIGGEEDDDDDDDELREDDEDDDDDDDEDLRDVHDAGYDSEADKEYALFGSYRYTDRWY